MPEKPNYDEIDFRAGLEIHQQLNTKKLFCNCLSVLRKDEPDFEVRRKLHAVAGESGEIDTTTVHEAEKNREFVYQGYDTTCLIELDEEPPHKINLDALKIAVQIALLLNMKIVPIAQIMRKAVIDGSNTSGFQRTVMIGRDGFVETSEGKVRIQYFYLEEDAARIIEKKENLAVYRLDRLGIPLVEVVTAPDIKTPEQAKETAMKIGEILRTCNVRRGIGTIRQDVNISIRGENRVEMKGIQDMNIFIRAIDNEIERQKILSDKKSPVQMEVRNVLPDATSEYMRPLPGSSRMYPETDLPLLKISLNLINEAKKTLPKSKGEIEKGLKGKGLNFEMINLLLKERKLEEFKELSSVTDKPSLAAKTLLVYPKEIASRKKISPEKIEEILNTDIMIFILKSVRDRKMDECHVKQAMERITDGESIEDAIKFETEDEGIAEEKIMKLIKDKPGLSEKAYMGLVMKEFRGKIDGKTASRIIERLME